MKLEKITDELYVPEDFTKHHAYYADPEGEKQYTGVTTILGVIAKPALIQWAANEGVTAAIARARAISKLGLPLTETLALIDATYDEARYAHRKKKEDAAEKGTDLHALVEEYVRRWIGGEHLWPDIPDKFKPIEAFIVWARQNEIRFIATEQRLYSKELWIAGTCDLIFEKDGKRYIGDIKTYKKLWDRVPLIQCAGYGIMWEEMFGEYDKTANLSNAIDGYCVIRIKDNDFEVQWALEPETDRKAFLAAVTLYRALQQWAA